MLAIPSRHLCFITSLLLEQDCLSIEGRLPSITQIRYVIPQSVCGSEIWSQHTRPASWGSATWSPHTPSLSTLRGCRKIASHPSWITAMDLPSPHLQQDCTLSISEEGGGIRFHAFLLLWPWPWPDDLDIWHDLKILKMYLHTKNKLSRSRFLGQGF